MRWPMDVEVVRGGALALHVLAGGLGLLLAVPVLLARKRRGGWHARLGRGYVGALALMATSALVLVAFGLGDAAQRARLLWLGMIAVLTLGWGVGGLLVARRRPRLPGGWRVWHLTLMGSSVLSFVTAFAVTALDGGVAAWVLPTVVGSPLLARAAARHAVRAASAPAVGRTQRPT